MPELWRQDLMRLARLLTLCSAASLLQAQIVFTHSPDGSPPWPTQDVWLMDGDGSNARALTSDGHSHNPVWSPDGSRILFIHDDALPSPPAYKEAKEYQSHHPIEIAIMDRDGANRRVIFRSAPVIYSAAWSPDGKTLAVSGILGGRTQLFLLAADGSGVPRSIAENGWTPAWSPDGKRLAFSVESPRGRWAIHIANADGTNDVRLDAPPLSSGLPAWSPDGRLIAFADSGEQIYLIAPDGANMRRVTPDAVSPCDHPAWAADGRHLVFACRSPLHCGGISDVGTPLPECTRRLFRIDAFDPAAQPAQLGDLDAAEPSVR